MKPFRPVPASARGRVSLPTVALGATLAALFLTGVPMLSDVPESGLPAAPPTFELPPMADGASDDPSRPGAAGVFAHHDTAAGAPSEAPAEDAPTF